MLKLAGSLLLMTGAAGLGLASAARLRGRVTGLRALMGALEQMARELDFRLTPMPELMAKLAAESRSPVADFFAYCRDHLDQLDQKRFGSVWREGLKGVTGLALEPQERQILETLGDVLGCYDGQGQREALHAAAQELSLCLRQAEEDRDRLSRVYTALGLGAGALVTILLI